MRGQLVTLVAAHGGYRLKVDRAVIDYHQFQGLLVDAQWRLRQRQPRQARDLAFQQSTCAVGVCSTTCQRAGRTTGVSHSSPINGFPPTSPTVPQRPDRGTTPTKPASPDDWGSRRPEAASHDIADFVGRDWLLPALDGASGQGAALYSCTAWLVWARRHLQCTGPQGLAALPRRRLLRQPAWLLREHPRQRIRSG